MTTTHDYQDPYLTALVTADRETRAMADVAALGSFAGDWGDKLVILRAYMITCVECQASPDDLFAQKLKHYRREFDTALMQARAATPKADGRFTMFSMPLERA